MTASLPANIDAEQALLGAILVNNEAFHKVSGLLTRDDFSEQLHRSLFDVIERQIGSGSYCSPITLNTALPDIEVGPDLPLRKYLARIAANAAPVMVVQDYARTIREESSRRDMIAISELLADAARRPSADIGSALTEAIGRLDALSGMHRYKSALKAVSAGEAMNAALDMAAAAYQRKGEISGVTYGLTDLDQVTCGLHPGEVVILAARPSMGKSAVALSTARSAAKAGHGTCFFSKEMSSVMLGIRLLSDAAYEHGSRIPYHGIRSGRISETDFLTLKNACEDDADLPFIIEEEPSLTVGQIAARARRAKQSFQKAGRDLKLIVVDYLQLVKPNDRYQGSKVNEIAEISAGLKAVAKELGVAMLALSQLSRDVEKRDDKRPMLSDLRDSGSIEQDADTVMFLYREEYYLRNREPKEGTQEFLEWESAVEACRNKLDIIVAKQRHGPTDTVKVFFDAGANAVRDLDRE